MDTIRTILAVAWKELQIISRERGGLAIVLLLPLVLGSLFAGGNLALSGDQAENIRLKVGLFNGDAGNFGTEFAKAVGGIEQLQVQTFTSAAEAEQQVAQGNISAAIVVPGDFTARIEAYTPTSVQVITDPAEPQSANIVTSIMGSVAAEFNTWGEVQHGIRTVLGNSGVLAGASPAELRAMEAQSLGVIMTRLNELRVNPAVVVVSQDLEGARLRGGWANFFAYLFGAFTVMFIFFIIGWAASSLLAERETGVLRRIDAAPIARWVVLAGKALAFMVIPCVQVALMFAIGHFIFGVPLGRSPAALILLTLAVSLAAVGFGLMLAGLARSAKQADSLGMILGLALAAVGGAFPFGMEPTTRQPGFIGALTQFTPQGHAVEGYYRIMAENAGLVRVLPQVGALVGMAVLFILVARWRFRWQE